MLGYDDSLDAFGVHGVGGTIGAILTGVFAAQAVGGTKGMLEGNTAQVGVQAYGVAVTIVYCAIVTFILLKIVDVIVGLRVDAETERDGLDLNLHGETVP
jgi:Amt family ammonium transporter